MIMEPYLERFDEATREHLLRPENKELLEEIKAGYLAIETEKRRTLLDRMSFFISIVAIGLSIAAIVISIL